MVTVPDRLRRVVCNAPQASAGYRGCSPCWRRSHHAGSPSSCSDREREPADISSSLNSLPLFALSLLFLLLFFLHSHTATLADRIDSLPACGCISPLRLVCLTSHTHPHPPTSLPCTLPPSACCSACGGQCQSSAINTPSCLLSSCSLTINE